MELFITYIKAGLKTQLQYKFNFIIDALVSGLALLTDFLIVALVMYNFKSINGWSIYDVAIVYSIIECGNGIYRIFGSGLDNFEEYTVNGSFDVLLIRPASTAIQVLLKRFEFKRIGIVIQSLIVGIWGLSNSNFISNDIYYLYPILIILAAIICIEISFVIAAVAFWTVKNEDLMVLGFYATRTAAFYPLNIYTSALRFTLTFIVPFATVGYYPIAYLTGKIDNILGLLAPIISVTFLVPISMFIWKQGIKKYSSTGT